MEGSAPPPYPSAQPAPDSRIRLLVADVWRIIFGMVINDAYGNTIALVDKLAPLSPYLARLFTQPWYYELMYCRYRQWYRQIFASTGQWSNDNYADVRNPTLGIPESVDEYYQVANTIMQQTLLLFLLLDERMKEKYQNDFIRDDGKWLGSKCLFDIQIAVGLNFDVCVTNLLPILEQFHRQYVAAPGLYGMNFRLNVCFDLLLGSSTLAMFKPTDNAALIDKVLAILLDRVQSHMFTKLDPENILRHIIKYGNYTMLQSIRKYYSRDSYLWLIDNEVPRVRLQQMAFEADNVDGLIFESGSVEEAERYVNVRGSHAASLPNIFRRFCISNTNVRYLSADVVEEQLKTRMFTLSYSDRCIEISLSPRAILLFDPKTLPAFNRAFLHLSIADKYANWHEPVTVNELLAPTPIISAENHIEFFLDAARVGQARYRRFLAYVFQHHRIVIIPPIDSFQRLNYIKRWLYYTYVYYFYLLGHAPLTPAKWLRYRNDQSITSLGRCVCQRIIFHSHQPDGQPPDKIYCVNDDRPLIPLFLDGVYLLPPNEDIVLYTGQFDIIVFESDMMDSEWLSKHSQVK